MVSFLESIGVTIAGAFFTASWHILSRNERPEFEDLAIGFDLLVATMVLQLGFLPGSHGRQTTVRWAALALVFLILMCTAVATRMSGYEPVRIYVQEDDQQNKLPLHRMTRKAVWVTSIVGSVVLCALWWLNVNVGLVVSAWKEVLH